MTGIDRAKLIRLRTAQRQTNANLNVIASYVNGLNRVTDARPSSKQWDALWVALEAADLVLRSFADELAEVQESARAKRRRILSNTTPMTKIADLSD